MLNNTIQKFETKLLYKDRFYVSQLKKMSWESVCETSCLMTSE